MYLHEYRRQTASLPSKLSPRQLHSAALETNLLYIFGGIDDTQQVFNDLYVYDFEYKTWSEIVIKESPPPRFAHSSVCYGDSLYVYGGAALGANTYGDVWKFNFKLVKWEQVIFQGGVPPTWSHSAVTYGKQMWIFGGFDTSWSDKLYSFDFGSKKWTEVKTELRPPSRQFHSAVVHEDSMYIYGGSTNTDCGDLWKFSFSKKKWDFLGSFVSRMGHQMVAIGNTLIMFGGKTGKKICNDFYFYDIKAKQWAPPSPINSKVPPRYYHSMVQWNGDLFLQGGKGNKECYNDQFQISFQKNNIQKSSIFSILPFEVLNLIHDHLHGADLLNFHSTSYENNRRVHDLQWKRVLEEIVTHHPVPMKSLYEKFLVTWKLKPVEEQVSSESNFWKTCLRQYILALRGRGKNFYFPPSWISRDDLRKQLKLNPSVKVVVMGPPGVGKSQSTSQYVQGLFYDRYDYIEDSFRKQVEVHGVNVMMEILDTVGTEQFIALRHLYIKNGDVIVLMYSITSHETFTELESLYEIIRQVRNEGYPPVVLAGNKIDLEDQREVSIEEGIELAQKWRCPFFETSAKIKTNNNELFLSTIDVFAMKKFPQSEAPTPSSSTCLVM